MPIFISKGGDRKQLMSGQEFKTWLMQFDANNDRRISRNELREAMRSRGVWFMVGWRARQVLREADADNSGYIDEKEIDSLLDFAESTLGFKFD